MRTYAVPIGVALALASSFTSQPVLATGIVLAALVAAAVIARCFDPAERVSTLP
jgi:hypothetical protein